MATNGGAYTSASVRSFTRHDSEESVTDKLNARRKKWCLYACAIASIVIFLVILTIYLVSPLIVRGHANHSTLTFKKIVLTNPQHDRVHMEAQIVMGELSSPVHSILDAMEMTMVYEGTDMAVTQMGAVELAGESEVHITQSGEMRVLSDEHFKKFSRDLLSKETLTWTLRGDLSAKLNLAGAWVSTPYSVEFSKDVEVPGFDHLKNISFHSLDIMVEEGTNRAMFLVRVQAFTPSIFDMVPVGNLAFNAFFEGEFIGIVKKENASMFSGPQGTLLELEGYFPSDPTAVTEMMSAYTNGEVSNMAARFSPEHSEIVLYDLSALAEHPTEMVVRGMQEELIQAALADRTYTDKHNEFAMPTQFWIWNPFDADVSIPSFNYTVTRYPEGDVVSQAARVLSPPMALNPAGFTLGTKLDLHPSYWKFMALTTLAGVSNIADLGKVVTVKLDGDFQLSVGDLTARIRYYSRKPMPLCWCTNPEPCGLASFCPASEVEAATPVPAVDIFEEEEEEEDDFFDL